MANILLVEDEPSVSETLSRALERQGHKVIAAANGIQGLKEFAKGAFDLVVTDIIMPDMEGIGMIMAMRREKPTVKIVAISGGGRTGNMEFLKMARSLGAMAAMKKPFRLLEFYEVLSDCLGERTGAGGDVLARR